MSKRAFKIQASSSRAASSSFGGGPPTGFATVPASSSSISYLAELPDISGISDPNIAVCFKNLTKKDPTTKSKALEELKLAFEKATEVEDTVLSAWAKLYPRTSIDNARRVRQLAHILQSQITTLAGKRVARFLPQVIPVWLAGQYDSDKLVAKAAQDAIHQVFPTTEKTQALRKLYQGHILDFVTNVTQTENAQTLSDERISSPDEAAQKYTRVTAAAVSLLRNLLSELPDEERQKCTSQYNALFESRELWSLALYQDSNTRRTIHQLLKVYCHRMKQPSLAALHALSSVYIYKGLDSDQTGSALEYLDGLRILTQNQPTVWTDNYIGKKSVPNRLKHLFRKGSQGAGVQYWRLMAQLLDHIPKSALPNERDDIDDALRALLKGFKERQESRNILGAAFSTYLHSASLISQSLEYGDRMATLKEFVFPLLDHYVMVAQEDQDLLMPPNAASTLIPKAISIAGIPSLVDDALPRWTDQLTEKLRKSLPESSKDHKQSQQDLIERGSRLALLMSSTLTHSENLRKKVLTCCSTVIDCCLTTCKARNGKPYGAAQIMVIFMKCPGLTNHDSEIWDRLDAFASVALPEMITSPSSEALIELLGVAPTRPSFRAALTKSIETVLEDHTLPSVAQASVLKKLMAISKFPQDLEQMKPLISRLLEAMMSEVLDGSNHEATALTNPVDLVGLLPTLSLDIESSKTLFKHLTEGLYIGNNANRLDNALQTLLQVLGVVPGLVQSYLAADGSAQLLSRILLLTEASDEHISTLAITVNDRLSMFNESDSHGPGSMPGLVNVIHSNLENASIDSVSVETLILQASKLLSKDRGLMPSLVPNLDTWLRTLQPFLSQPTPKSAAITHSLGGAIYFAKSETEAIGEADLARDAQGLAVPLRMAMFLSGLLEIPDEPFVGSNPLVALPLDTQQKIFISMILTMQLANENLSVLGCNKIFNQNSVEVIDEIVDFVTKVNAVIRAWQLSGAWWDYRQEPSPTLFLRSTLDLLLAESRGSSTLSLAYAQAYETTMSQMIEIHGWKQDMSTKLEEDLRELRRSKEVIRTVAFLLAHRLPLESSAFANRFCNELIADLTGSDASYHAETVLRQLVLLNTMLQYRGSTSGAIAKQRIVFLVKKTAGWLMDSDTTQPIKAEICKALTMLLPLIGDIYGAHWDDLISFITSHWNTLESLVETTEFSPLPLLHATFRLHLALRKIADGEDGNGDLQDELDHAEQSISTGLLNVLSLPRQKPDDMHQPLSIVNQLLQRQVRNMSKIWIKDVDGIYAIVLAPSRALQEAAYEVLHSYIPNHQEQVVFDTALEKKAARLPDELLSLLLETPTPLALEDAAFDTDVPPGLRGYMLSWLLVFDHFTNVPFTVRDQYIAHLKEGTYVDDLLDFISTFLGLAEGKSFDVFKFHSDIPQPFTSSVGGTKSFAVVPVGMSRLQETQWLLCHLYYLCLFHLPSMAKGWWLDCKSRQKSKSIESWTSKFISPRIISAALVAVNDWSKTQDSDGDEKPLDVRVSQQTGTVLASYPIDESSCAISIALPPTFPLHQATVTSISRIVVDERRWQSWLRTTQGVIAFSNNNVVEGLIVWRKNVVGQLKGQTECAICYAIVAEDGKLPNKKCRTSPKYLRQEADRAMDVVVGRVDNVPDVILLGPDLERRTVAHNSQYADDEVPLEKM